MEARATINGTSISKTFVAAVLVLVAMGLGAMAGYVVKGLGASGASTTVSAPAQSAPARSVELPGYIQGEIDRAAQPTPHISTTDPGFIEKYGPSSAADGNQVIGTRGDHGDLQ